MGLPIDRVDWWKVGTVNRERVGGEKLKLACSKKKDLLQTQA